MSIKKKREIHMFKKAILAAAMGLLSLPAAASEEENILISPILRVSEDFSSHIKEDLNLKPSAAVMPYAGYKVATKEPVAAIVSSPNIMEYYANLNGASYVDTGIRIEQELSAYVRDSKSESWDDADSISLGDIEKLSKSGKVKFAVSSPAYSVSGMALLKSLNGDFGLFDMAHDFQADESSLGFVSSKNSSVNLLVIESYIGDYLKKVGILGDDFKKMPISDAGKHEMSLISRSDFKGDFDIEKMKSELSKDGFEVKMSKAADLDPSRGLELSEKAKEIHNDSRDKTNVVFINALSSVKNEELVSGAIDEIKSGAGWFVPSEQDSIEVKKTKGQSLTVSIAETFKLADKATEGSLLTVVVLADSEGSLPDNFAESYMNLKSSYDAMPGEKPRLSVVAIGDFNKSKFRSIAGLTLGNVLSASDELSEVTTAIDGAIAN